MTQAILYTRFSPHPGQDECQSNINQLVRCEAHCTRRGHRVYGAYSDDAVSGTLIDRPALSLAIEALGPGMVFVVDRIDRLARDMLVGLTLRHQIEKTGATIEFADGSPNDSTPEGKLFSNILAAFAAFERDRIAARTSAGLKRKQAAGEYLGRPPVGYRVDPETKRLVRHEGEQRAMMAAIKLSRDEGRNNSEFIAGCLNRTHGSLRGRPWSPRTVRKILALNRADNGQK